MTDQTAQHPAAPETSSVWPKGRLVEHPTPGKVWVQVPHRNDIGSDWIEADILPAAPETDVSTPRSRPADSWPTAAELSDWLSRCTSEERLSYADHALATGQRAARCVDHQHDADLTATRERLRVVEGERDAARAEADYEREQHEGWVRFAAHETVRAESAEADRDALRAGIEALHAKVPMHPHEEDCALPDEHRDDWDFDGEFCPVCEPDWFSCETCKDEDGSFVEWPCETAALLPGDGR